jgi:hypothetical protein
MDSGSAVRRRRRVAAEPSGLEGFLNRWAVSFNSYLGYFTVESVDDFHSRQPPWILAALEGLVGT